MVGPILFHGHFSACLHISGADAYAFVQSQLAARIPPPEASSWGRGLWLNARGRIIAESFAWAQASDSVLLWSYDCPSALLKSAVLANLIADEVEIEDVTSRFLASWIQAEWLTLIPGIGELSPPDTKEVLATEDAILCRPGGEAGTKLLVIAEQTFSETIQEAIIPGVTACKLCPMHSEERELLRIESGIPAIPRDLNEFNLPQEGNTPPSWVAMDKGCFPGREILASFQRGGKLAKTLVRCRIPKVRPECLPPLPIPVHSGTLEAGTLTSIAFQGDTILGLAMMRTRHLDKPLTVPFTDGSNGVLEILSDL